MSLRNEIRGIFQGISLLIVLHFTAITIGSILIAISTTLAGPSSYLASGVFWSFFCISLVQLIYVIPAAVVLYRQERFSAMKGVILGAVLTALLNGGCWLWLYASLR